MGRKARNSGKKSFEKKKNKSSSGIHVTLNKKEITKYIHLIFSQNPSNEYNYKQIARQLDVTDGLTRQLISETLDDLAIEGVLQETSRGRYKALKVSGSAGNTVEGVLDMAKSGFGFVRVQDQEEDIYISQERLNKALNKDIVRVNVLPGKRGKNPEGEVIEIVKRGRSQYVGVIELSRNFAFLVSDNERMTQDIFIPLNNLNGAEQGEKVVVEMTDWPDHAKNPFGKVIQVLGKVGENNTEMHAILAEYELPNHFPQGVLDAAEEISDKITKEEIKKRRDFRDILTFTIDPVDAKDFDDALSLKKLDNGNWEVGVHIADVTHYVKPDTILEEEAFDRATSVYLVDRVVPMLPERLSNKLCSLRPNEEKLCFSAVFEINDEAQILNEWFGRTIIESKRRFTYEEAQAVIDTGKGDYADEIQVMNGLAKQLRAERFKNGAIGFERTEVKFNIDEMGKPLGVYFKEHGDSNHLIEEFMLLANRKVAAFIGDPKNAKPKTFVYRVHDKPNEDKVNAFAQFIVKFGYQINQNSDKTLSQSINDVLEKVRGKKEQNLVETLALRSMAKAFYSTKNAGHYGLHFKHYSHFTSPIRRYPDMMVHRLLQMYLDGEKSQHSEPIEKQCEHASEMERRAAEAERSSIKYKQVEFLSDKIGQTFDGVISGVTEWGIFVELEENKCEGLVPMKDLADDFYVYDQDNYCLVGREFGKKYQLGDKVKVKVWKANLERKQLDFLLDQDE